MKLNKKGFMMAELVVVSAIVLTFLAGIYVSYNKIYSAYKTRLNYYDVTALYRLNFYKDFYNEYKSDCHDHAGDTAIFECKKNEAKNASNHLSQPFVELINSNVNYENVVEKVFIIYNDYENLGADILKDQTVNKTYKDYVNYLSTAVDLTGANYVLTIERCQEDGKSNCKYAYLEVSE